MWRSCEWINKRILWDEHYEEYWKKSPYIKWYEKFNWEATYLNLLNQLYSYEVTNEMKQNQLK